MCINLRYCLVCPIFLLQDTRLCHGASKAPRTICICVVLRNLLCLLALPMSPKECSQSLKNECSICLKKWYKNWSQDFKLFIMEQTSVPKIQGRAITRQDCCTVDAALKENLEFFVFIKVCGPLAKATRRSQSKELKFFTKAKIRLQLRRSTPWSGLGRPGATMPPGMPSTTSTSFSGTWTEGHHHELQENQEIDQNQDSEPWWASFSGSEAAEIAEYFTTTSSATSSDDNGPETSPIKWYDHAPHEFQQAIDFYEGQQQGHQEFDMRR